MLKQVHNGNVSSVSLCAVVEWFVLQVSLTVLIAVVVGILAFSAYGSLTAAILVSTLSALLWIYLIRL
jgi:hypothetical protein